MQNKDLGVTVMKQSKYGNVICVLLYAVAAYFCGKKKFIPLLLLMAAHTGEFFLKGRPIAKAKGIGMAEAFLNCLFFGIAWWRPLRDSDS